MKMRIKAKQKLNKRNAIIFSAIALIIVGIITLCAVHSDKPAILDIKKDVADGIDISSHNKRVEWDKLCNDIDFAIIRVGYRGYGNGEIKADEKARYNIRHATNNDIPVGVYFYSQAINEDEAIKEAEKSLKMIKTLDVTLPIFIDFEYAYKGDKLGGRLFDADLSSEDATNIINAFCNRVKKDGYNAGVYASSYMLEQKINVNDLNKDTVIWVADYNDAVTYSGRFDIWQYTNKGKMKAVHSKYVDKNYWYIRK